MKAPSVLPGYLVLGACVALAVAWGMVASPNGWGGSDGKPLPSGVISGTVTGEDGMPVSGANVRIQGTENRTETDASGRFILSGIPLSKKVNVSAWKQGYYCGLFEEAAAPSDQVALQLMRYQTRDNPDYAWIPPVAPGNKGSCAECHHPALIEMALEDAHLKSAANPRFLTLYHGTDVQGNRSALTRYSSGKGIWQNASIPQPPDPSDPYYGPGYLLDFPGTPGTCSACHVPGASISQYIDPATATGADRYGVHCDFCHKVADVHLDPVTGLPLPEFPGVHSMEIRRPFTEDPQRFQLFFGTFDDDNVPKEDTNLPLLKESRYCAPCHSGVFWSTVAYNSYGEWLDSPYSDPASGKGKTCQECHMTSPTTWKGQELVNVAPGKGGIDRNPAQIHSHLTTVDENLLRNALTVRGSAQLQDGKVMVEVTLHNDKTGHHVPSDCPLRHLILLVEARNADGQMLQQVSGPVLPPWCGVGNPEKGYVAGLPGKTFAKLLKEMWTDVFPATAYWRHTTLVSDNRLAAFAGDTSSYSFLPGETGDNVVTVTLLYRRAPLQLMDQKKWDVPDVVMARGKLTVKGGEAQSFQQP